LKPEEWDQLNDLAGRLEEAWQRKGSADLARLLPAPGHRLRLPFLRELIKTELEIRWRRSRPVLLDEYLLHFPELGPAGSLPVDLIYEEMRVRHLFGDRPALASYRKRFPRQFEQLERLVQKQPFRTEYRALSADATRAEGLAAPPPPPPSGEKTVRGDPADTPAPPDEVPAARTVITAAGPRGDKPPGHTTEVLAANEGFTLLDRIGAGEFGEVFRARAPGGIEVAVKRIFRPLEHDASRREVQALELIRNLRHPFLLQTQQYWALEDRLVIVMELAEDSLHDWFKQCRRDGLSGIPADDLVAYFREAAEAIDYLHSQHVLHRDIKPANLLRLKGHAKVADFGLARLLEKRMTTATLCGTPLYMPPEMWQGKVSLHSDQYSLAAAYVEMRLGRRLFPGKDQFQIGMQHLQKMPNLDPLPEAEQRVLLRGLAKDPDQRYPNCREFARALAEAVAPPPPPPPPVRPRRYWDLALLAVALLGCLAGLVWKMITPTSAPAKAKPWLPAGFVAAQDARVERRFYDRIEYRLDGAAPLVFLLIPHTTPDDPPSFYILRDKVTNEQFRALMRDAGMQELLHAAAAKHPWTVRHEWEKIPLAAATVFGLPFAPFDLNPLLLTLTPLPEPPRPPWNVWWDPALGQLPVMDVTVTEADCFAKKVGGRLPRIDEWYKAGGKLDRAAGPFLSGWKPGEVALGLDRPRPVGASRADVSPFGCRDMAANGREFTCNLLEPEDARVPAPDPRPNHYVLLLGQSFTGSKPFCFGDPRQTLRYGESLDDIGFRVVVVIDAPAEP
jgi:formylglycine-generating enzyme required for sulfatase activity